MKERFAGRPVVLWGVNTSAIRDTLMNMRERYHWGTLPVLYSADNDYQSYGMTDGVLPMYILIDKEGTIQHREMRQVVDPHETIAKLILKIEELLE